MAITQLGTTVVVGLNGRNQGTLLDPKCTENPTGEIKEITEANAAVCTKLCVDRGRRLTITGVMLSDDYTTLNAAKPGDTITLDGDDMMLESLQLEFSSQEARARIVAVKENSMSYL